jgi:hypothetical protein
VVSEDFRDAPERRLHPARSRPPRVPERHEGRGRHRRYPDHDRGELGEAAPRGPRHGHPRADACRPVVPAEPRRGLVEGIADWIRFVQFEPDHPQPPINPERSSYREGYRTTFRFLDWAQRTHDKELIIKLNKALRQRRYNDDLFKEYTGKTLDELWKEFAATLPKRKA